MSVTALLKLVPPPASPTGVGRLPSWIDDEAKLGTGLPSDYKEFVTHYGTGLFADFFIVYNLLARDTVFGLIPNATKELAMIRLRNYKTIFGDDFPYGIFPDKPGLLPWGKDENGGTYCWLTAGKSDSWPVVHIAGRPGKGDWQQFRLTMSGYLLKVLKKQLKSKLNADDEYPFPEQLVFKPLGINEQAPKRKG
jgi:hypothetical protein